MCEHVCENNNIFLLKHPPVGRAQEETFFKILFDIYESTIILLLMIYYILYNIFYSDEKHTVPHHTLLMHGGLAFEIHK